MARAQQAVLDTLRERLTRRPEILEAYCFGSHARGEAAAHSDLDIAVYVDREHLPPAPFGYAAELIGELMAGLAFDRLDVGHAPNRLTAAMNHVLGAATRFPLQ